MKTIKEANKVVADVWGKGKVKSGGYRRMTYTIPVAVEDGTLLHNAVTGELVLLNDEETEQMSALPCDYAPWMDELIQKRFLVKAENNDEKTVNTLRMAFAMVTRKKSIHRYTILPTTYCNARCFYCYESNAEHIHMSDETADKLVEFMLAHRGNEKLHIGWFGGEPLIGLRQINRISAALKAKEVPFTSSMISNGYLFTPELARRAREDWNLKGIQITLDGTEQVYNQTKAYRNSSGSPYQQVLRNIDDLLNNGIRVGIRLNLGVHNAGDLSRLVDELAERFRGMKGLTVYSHILLEGVGFDPAYFEGDALAKLMEKQEALTEQIQSHSLGGISRSLPILRAHQCMADNDSAVMVLPSGRLGKCEHYTDSHFVGSIETGVTDSAECRLFKERNRFSHCSDCPLYPSCIKLKRCQPNGLCTEDFAKKELQDTVRKIRFIYEASLRDDSITVEAAELPDC